MNEIFLHENDNFAIKISWDVFFCLEMSKRKCAVHYFMHRILIHESFGAKIFVFMHGNIIFMHEIFIFDYFYEWDFS